MAAGVLLGEQVRGARERRHLTQQQLADVLGVDRKTIDNWENGRTSPRNRMGALIAWAPELGGEELDPQEQEIMAMQTIDPALKRAYIELYRQRRRGGEAPQKRAG